jgi:hypothetical protein
MDSNPSHTCFTNQYFPTVLPVPFCCENEPRLLTLLFLVDSSLDRLHSQRPSELS